MRRLAAATAAAVVSLFASVSLAQPDAQLERLVARTTAQIEDFTGPVELHCGIYLRTRDAAGVLVAANRKQIATALRCVTRAKRLGRAAWAIWEQPQGADSTAFGGFATTATSDIHTVSVNIGVGTRFILTPCLRPRVDKQSAVTCRNKSQSLSDGDLENALSKLRRDVARTSSAPEDVVATVAQRAREDSGATPGDGGSLTKIVNEVQLTVQTESAENWPLCPRHHTHALEFRDDRWFCGRDSAFIVELGGLRKVLPKRRQ